MHHLAARPAWGSRDISVLHATAADGTRIEYEVHGAETPSIVLVHGWSCDRSVWRHVVPLLAADREVVTLDLPGHGTSGHDRTRWTIEAFGDDVARIVKAAVKGKVVLVGHSMGGDVILDAARLLPGRVTGLVWIDVYETLDGDRSPGAVDRIVAPIRASFRSGTETFVRGMFLPDADRAIVAEVVGLMSGATPRIAVPLLSASMKNGTRVPTLLAELGLPTIALNPAEPPSDEASLARHGVRLVTLPGVGHFPMLERPAEFAAALASAVAELGLSGDAGTIRSARPGRGAGTATGRTRSPRRRAPRAPRGPSAPPDRP